MADTLVIDCPLCGDIHFVDKYDWVDSCEGYISLDDFRKKMKNV